jgi:hypothetical protein
LHIQKNWLFVLQSVLNNTLVYSECFCVYSSMYYNWPYKVDKCFSEGQWIKVMLLQFWTVQLSSCSLLESTNKIVKIYITAVLIKPMNAMRFCWQNIKYVTTASNIVRHEISTYGNGCYYFLDLYSTRFQEHFWNTVNFSTHRNTCRACL